MAPKNSKMKVKTDRGEWMNIHTGGNLNMLSIFMNAEQMKKVKIQATWGGVPKGLKPSSILLVKRRHRRVWNWPPGTQGTTTVGRCSWAR